MIAEYVLVTLTRSHYSIRYIYSMILYVESNVGWLQICHFISRTKALNREIEIAKFVFQQCNLMGVSN